ncbi:FlgO family outer membrane protein [Desulfocastanea catecholica]
MLRCKIPRLFPTSSSGAPSITVVALVCILFFLSGCASFNCTRLETIFGDKTNLIQFSYTIAEHLTERSRPPLVPRHPDMPVLVTTFVDNNDLQQTSRFGRVLQEQVASRLVQLGYTVREMKIAGTLHIEPRSGETILSRDLAQLSNGQQQAQAILVGTISRSNRLLYISARLIHPVNNTILATDDYQLCMDDEILAMFDLQRQPERDQPIAEPRQPFLNSIL